MTKKEEIVRFILTLGVVAFGIMIISFGFRMILTPFLN